MKILIDASTARAGGGTTYLRCLLPALREHSPSDELFLLLSESYQRDLLASLGEGICPLLRPLSPRRPVRYFQLRYQIPRLVDALGVDLFFSVSELTVPCADCPTVILVRNMKLFAAADYAPSFRDRIRLGWRQLPARLLLERTLHTSTRLVFVTNWFRQYVVEKSGLDPGKTSVIPVGVTSIFHDARTSAPGPDEKDPYILVVSNITFHKNLSTAIRGLAAFLEREGKSRLKMRIAGPVTERRLYEKLRAECASSRIEDRVVFLGEVSREELTRLYSKARIFLFPSLLESFGNPLLEALASGVPAIVSDLPVFREIAGDAVEYFPPHRPDLLAEKISMMTNDSALCGRRSAAGLVRAATFSWEETATKLRRLFQEAVDGASESTMSRARPSRQRAAG